MPSAPSAVFTGTAGIGDLTAASQFNGRTIEAVRVIGNTQVSTSVVLELVRTHEGDKFDPATVVADYQRIYDKLKMFGNVEARVQPTYTGGVVVLFIVTEQKQIHEIRFEGNVKLSTHDLQDVVDLKVHQAVDRFRISLARQSIEKLYHDKNYPFAHVQVSEDDLAKGDVVFRIVEGPQVRVRKVDFIGNNSFSTWRLKDEIKTAYYIFIFRPGTFDPELVDEDVDLLTHFYQSKGFFDVRVGRRLSRSADMKEMQVTFLIDEGPRYIIDHIEFKGNKAVAESTFRKDMTMLEGTNFDQDGVNRDTRAIVKAYSKVGGYIYEQQPGQNPDPDYLQITAKKVFKREPGKLDLIYEISEGKQFILGRILTKGNAKTKDNVILREMRMSAGAGI